MTGERFVAMAVVGLLLAGSLLINSRQRAPDVVRVGVTFNLSASTTGQQMFHAIEMALAAHNLPDGMTVELLPYDYAAETSDERKLLHNEAMEALSADDSVIAVIGAPNTSFATDVLAMTNNANLPVISPAATWPGLTLSGYRSGEPGIYYPTGQRTFFRTIPTDDIQGLAALNWLSQQGVTDIFVLTLAGNVYSEGLGGIVIANADDYGVTVVDTAEYPFDEQADAEAIAAADVAIATQIQQANVGALYYPAVVPVGAYSILATIRATNPELIIFGSEGLPSDPDVAELSDMSALYATSLTPDPAQLPAASSFIAAFEDSYGAAPLPFTINAHDAMVAILTALEDTPRPTREAVRQRLFEIDAVDGAMGTWRFNANGDITLGVVSIQQFHDSQWQTIETIQP